MRHGDQIHRGLYVRSVCTEALSVHKEDHSTSHWDWTVYFFNQVCQSANLPFTVKITESIKRNASPEKQRNNWLLAMYFSINLLTSVLLVTQESVGESWILTDWNLGMSLLYITALQNLKQSMNKIFNNNTGVIKEDHNVRSFQTVEPSMRWQRPSVKCLRNLGDKYVAVFLPWSRINVYNTHAKKKK